MDTEKNNPDKETETRKVLSGACFTASPIMLFVLFLYIFCSKKLPEFQVISVSINRFNLSTSTSACCSEITANWNITFQIRNREKESKVAYERFDVDISYEKELLSGTTIKPFYQKEHEQNLLNAKICAPSIDVSNQKAQAMEYELITKGTVNFDVTIHIRAYFSTVVPDQDFRTREEYEIWVSCDNLEVRFSSNTSLVGAMLIKSPSPCKITDTKQS